MATSNGGLSSQLSNLVKDLGYFLIPDQFSVLLFNSRSICNKLCSLRSLANLTNPCCILITETWCTSDISNLCLILDGYNIYRNDRKTTKGGGCIIYVRSDFISAKAYPHGWDLLEDAVFVNVSNCNHYSMIVGCVYRPPNSELIIDEHIKEIFLNLSSQNTHILVGGDFNMPEVSWNTFSGPSRFHALLETLDTNGWIQIVDGHTRKNSQLDLIFLNNLPQYTAHISGEFPESDHKVVTCQLIVPCRCVSTIPISMTEVRRNLTDAD